MIDLEVYQAGGATVVHGTPLYDAGVVADLKFTYPPFAALLFAPLAFLPLWGLRIVWTLANLALLVYVVWQCGRHLGMRADTRLLGLTMMLTGLAFWLVPVRTTFYLGQINIVLLALVAWDLLGRRRSGWQGVGVGIAAAIKLTPLIFIVYLAITRRIRAACVAVVAFAATVVASFVLVPSDAVKYWLHGTFAAADRVADVAAIGNQSLRGMLERFAAGEAASPWVWLASTGMVGVLGLAVASSTHRRGHELLGLTLCGLCATVVSPFSWQHHWVWFAPLLVFLVHRAITGSSSCWGLAAVLYVATFAWLTDFPSPSSGLIPNSGLVSLEPDQPVLAFLTGNAYVLVFVGALGLTAWWLRRETSRLLETDDFLNGQRQFR
ncbi:glycosyltransferase 87 family protein [Longimycelium tulufanense]|nr:glycosyltransferase 87 family protein [Longimycelium tulufanense]